MPDFAQFQDSAQTRADVDAGPRADPSRFNRVGGWIARYRRTNAGIDSNGPLVVASRVDAFSSAHNAAKDLDAYETAYRELGGSELVAPDVGDGTVAFSLGGGADGFFLVAWRHDNATASVLVEGSHVTLGDATTLARKQDTRIATATAGTRAG